MLIVSRRQGQRIEIGDDIYITVIEVKGGQVSIGIDAPKSVCVNREELCQEDKDNNAIRFAA